MGKQYRSKHLLELLLNSNIFKSNSKYKSRALAKKPFYFVLLTNSYHHAISAKLLQPRMKTATAFRVYTYCRCLMNDIYLVLSGWIWQKKCVEIKLRVATWPTLNLFRMHAVSVSVSAWEVVSQVY